MKTKTCKNATVVEEEIITITEEDILNMIYNKYTHLREVKANCVKGLRPFKVTFVLVDTSENSCE